MSFVENSNKIPNTYKTTTITLFTEIFIFVLNSPSISIKLFFCLTSYRKILFL